MQQLNIPTSIDQLDPGEWASFEPYFTQLMNQPITPENAGDWLMGWSNLAKLFEESFAWVYIQKSIDTTNEAFEQTFLKMIEAVLPEATMADNQLKLRLLSEALPYLPDGLELTVKNLKTESELFREENIPLNTELEKLGNEYDKRTGSLSMDWEGEQKNLSQLGVYLNRKDRQIREKAWRGTMGLWLSERENLNALYTKMLKHRVEVAKNAGFDDFRAYSFLSKKRFDYTPADCETFHNAIEQVVVPAAQKIYARKQSLLNVDQLRPWDVSVEPGDTPPLAPYEGQDSLIQHSLNVFQQIDPQLAHYFGTMADEDLLDLDTRSGKALGGYCSRLALRKRPFIFMNGVGLHDDVQTLLHEAGHAFHEFESNSLPYIWQTESPMEFSEVASMAAVVLGDAEKHQVLRAFPVGFAELPERTAGR
ncbi:MAG: M3 family metallopeptidase, partial [Chloroflexota bacterium]